MKLLRIWFVVLLAVLLPIRGAMAATMPCAPTSAAAQVGMYVEAADADHGDAHPHHSDHAAQMAAVDASDHSAHDHGSQSSSDHDHKSQKCNMCSASCSVPPMPSASAGISEPMVLTDASFPSLAAPAPSFLSDGQERPPRTI